MLAILHKVNLTKYSVPNRISKSNSRSEVKVVVGVHDLHRGSSRHGTRHGSWSKRSCPRPARRHGTRLTTGDQPVVWPSWLLPSMSTPFGAQVEPRKPGQCTPRRGGVQRGPRGTGHTTFSRQEWAALRLPCLW